MSLKFVKYRPKTPTVDVLEVTTENIAEIVEFMVAKGFKWTYEDGAASAYRTDGSLAVDLGDFLIFDDATDGRLLRIVERRDVIEQDYERA